MRVEFTDGTAMWGQLDSYWVKVLGVSVTSAKTLDLNPGDIIRHHRLGDLTVARVMTDKDFTGNWEPQQVKECYGSHPRQGVVYFGTVLQGIDGTHV